MSIFLGGNDFESEFAVTRKNSATGASEAAASLTGLTSHLSLTDGGATIHADVSVSMAERSSTAGTYFGVIEGDKIDTHLAALAGSVVWEVFGDATNVYVSKEHHVFATRPPD